MNPRPLGPDVVMVQIQHSAAEFGPLLLCGGLIGPNHLPPKQWIVRITFHDDVDSK